MKAYAFTHSTFQDKKKNQGTDLADKIRRLTKYLGNLVAARTGTL